MSTEIRRLIDKWRKSYAASVSLAAAQMSNDLERNTVRNQCADELEALLASPVGQEELDTTCDNDVGRTCKQLWPTARPSWCCGCLNTLVEPVGQEEPHPAIVFNRWFETAAAGEPFFPGLYSSDQLRTVAWLAFQAGRVTPSWHPPVEEQGGRQ